MHKFCPYSSAETTLIMDAAINQLAEFGFDRTSAENALLATKNHSVEAALELLLSGTNSSDVPSTTSSLQHDTLGTRVLILGLSQYTFSDLGSSACTSISAAALITLLEHYDSTEGRINSITEEMLSNSVINGVISHSAVIGSIDHCSIEDLLQLQPELSSKLVKIGDEPLQGLVSDSTSFEKLFDRIEKLSPNNHKAIGVIITKPPETVLVVLPPAALTNATTTATTIAPSTTTTTSQRTTSTFRGPYAFFDSHSRPQLGLDGSYLVETRELEEIINRLKDIFSAEVDSSDSYYSMMYNTFEGTAFQLK